MRGRGPRCLDRTIAGHDLPHTEVGEGRAALNREANGAVGEGFFFSQRVLWVSREFYLSTEEGFAFNK